ncbi:MAG: hypothetical protein GY841_11135 [FCB group bacterium]|nr:hypothetical protein [FCB group bacterium]
MLEFLGDWIEMTWEMLVSSALFLFFGFILAGIIRALVTPDVLKSMFGRGRFAQIFRASLIGVPLPLCSCSVLPVAAQLHRSGLSRSGTVSFLVSTPETGADSIALSIKLLGPVFAVIRPVAALFTALISGTLVAILLPANNTKVELATLSPQKKKALTLVERLREGQIYVATDMFPELAYYLFWGFVLAGAIAALVPADILESGLPVYWQYPAIVAFSLPVYVCATSSTPLAAVFLMLGVTPGAVLAFLLIGPASNMTALVVQKKILGLKGTIIMTVTIIITAVVFGLLLDYIGGGDRIMSAFHPLAAGGGEHHVWYDTAAGIIMGSLMFYYTLRHYLRKLKKRMAV